MNVKPGDLAYTVAPYVVCGRGYVVRVIRLAAEVEVFGLARFTQPPGRIAWVCEGSVMMDTGFFEPMTAIDDACLRPLRDPGEDAVDETLLSLPAPREAVPA